MSKICPNCHEEFDDNHGFCSNCGSRLVDKVESIPGLNIGDANAISGGVNINQSKNITSHDTHYHSTTIQERSKSESELRLDATNQLRAKAEEIMSERGRIDSVAMSQLRPLATQLGLDDETFKSIIKEVRSNRNGAASGLSAANARYLRQAQEAVQTNDMDALSNLTPRLEAMAAISQDENVQYLYYLTLSIFDPIKSMEVYERQTDENYWRSFWAIISYIRTGKHKDATKVLALFDPLRYEKSEEDQNLLEAYFNIMKEDKDGAQEFLDEILGEPTEQVKPLLRAVESKLYEEEPESLEVRFYMERVMSKSDVIMRSQKKAEISMAAEEPEKVAPKAEKEQKSPPTVEVQPASAIKKENKEAEELYAQACAASGAKRVMLLQKAADAGSLDAMFDLAVCYDHGDGVDVNKQLSSKWMENAANLGHLNAQAVMGAAYLYGEDGVEQNYVLSEKYLLLAAERNDLSAQSLLTSLYFDLEDFKKCIVWGHKAAQRGDVLACNILGDIYLEGLGNEKDVKEGLKWYEIAASKGDSFSQNKLGYIYSNSDYIDHDYIKAFDYYLKAAIQGNIVAMLNLGLCYASGQGTEMDQIKAGEWLRKAAEGGLQEAIDTLNDNPQYQENGVTHALDFKIEDNNSNAHSPLIINGTKATTETSSLSEAEANVFYKELMSHPNQQVLEKLQRAADAKDEWALFFLAKYAKERKDGKEDYFMAFKLFQEAAKKGNVRATVGLANCFYFGIGVDKDYTKAFELYKKAADLGNGIALYSLGMCYYSGNGIEQDYKRAVELLIKACDSDCNLAYGVLGACYYEGLGTKQDYKKAVELCKKASELDDDLAMVILGNCYSEGKGVEQNYEEAFNLYKKAADAGYIEAMLKVGLSYETGNGVNQDFAEAVRWYQKALDSGYSMDDWISNRLKECNDIIQRNNVKVEIKNIRVTQINDHTIAIHSHFIVKNQKGKTLKLKFETKSWIDGLPNTLYPGYLQYDAEVAPYYDDCEWKDYIYYIDFKNSNNGLTSIDAKYQLETKLTIYGPRGKRMQTEKIKYIVEYRSSMFRANKATLIN